MKPERRPLSEAGALAIVGLVAAAAGVALQVALGVGGYPAVPPGLVVPLAAAGLVALEPRGRWAPVIGLVLAAAALADALLAPGTGERMSDPDALGAYAGTVVQLVGLVSALGAGVAAVQNRTLPRDARR